MDVIQPQNVINETLGDDFEQSISSDDIRNDDCLSVDREENRPASSYAQMAGGKTFKPRQKPYLYTPSGQQIAESEQWVAYINGNGKKPRQLKSKTLTAPTVISSNHTEKARNKPIVDGKCATIKTKLFLDSGAEINVIDNKFLQELVSKHQAPVSVNRCTSNIKCANGSRMTVLGEATLIVEIASVKSRQKFLIVNNLFPKVIIGIRAMKTMSISIDPENDCIFVNKERIPFMSKVDPQSEESFMGNGEKTSF
jgi:hypothetical protein